ncbi:MAG: helix-turn-helix domain-containing protein [Bacteroidales bacterium]|jgi:transcriptional regulator with XRE-family HTH domain|nr:helix-turn-helix domain-containing protein [Bacteroidales bacterium]
MKDRLLKIITSEGLTPSLLADEMGLQRSGISHILSGRNYPSFDFLQKLLARFPKLNAEWLLLGQGSMYKSTVADLPDLFAAPAPVEKTSPPAITGESKKISPGESDKRKMPGNEAEMPSPTVPQKTIEKMIVLYSDKTFATYYPE